MAAAAKKRVFLHGRHGRKFDGGRTRGDCRRHACGSSSIACRSATTPTGSIWCGVRSRQVRKFSMITMDVPIRTKRPREVRRGLVLAVPDERPRIGDVVSSPAG